MSIANSQKMSEITTTELPQNLQTLLIEVERTKTPLTVIHDGKPLVIIFIRLPLQPHVRLLV